MDSAAIRAAGKAREGEEAVMHAKRDPNPISLRASVLQIALAAVVLAPLAFLATSCGCLQPCHQEVHIRAGEGAEGMVPGTVTVQRGQRICWTNDDSVPHTVRFTNSPGSEIAAPQDIPIPAGGTKKLKVHRNKPSGSYELHIDPPARTDGLWPPGEPEVIVE